MSNHLIRQWNPFLGCGDKHKEQWIFIDMYKKNTFKFDTVYVPFNTWTWVATSTAYKRRFSTHTCFYILWFTSI